MANVKKHRAEGLHELDASAGCSRYKTDIKALSNQGIKSNSCLPLPQEEGLRKGGEPKYAHLSMELHVFIEVFAPVPDAYLRMAHAMEEVKKFLFPVSFASMSIFVNARVNAGI